MEEAEPQEVAREVQALGKLLIWAVLAVIALFIVGMLVTSVLAALVKFAFYLIVGAAAVGGLAYLVHKARGAVRAGRRSS